MRRTDSDSDLCIEDSMTDIRRGPRVKHFFNLSTFNYFHSLVLNLQT